MRRKTRGQHQQHSAERQHGITLFLPRLFGYG